MLDVFDSDAPGGLGLVGGLAILAIAGWLGFSLWMLGYQRGTEDVLRFEAPGCVVTDAAGKIIPVRDLTHRMHKTMPAAATLTAACVNTL